MPDDKTILDLAKRVTDLRTQLASAEASLIEALGGDRRKAPRVPAVTPARPEPVANGKPKAKANTSKGHTGRSEKVKAAFMDGKEHVSADLQDRFKATPREMKRTLGHLAKQKLIKGTGAKGTYKGTQKLLSSKKAK